jgi:hypothetical protein
MAALVKARLVLKSSFDWSSAWLERLDYQSASVMPINMNEGWCVFGHGLSHSFAAQHS